MKAITTIKNTGIGSKAIYNGANKLIATASEVKTHDDDFGYGKYRICIVGGIAHGKIAYASNFQDLNDKSVEISKIPAD